MKEILEELSWNLGNISKLCLSLAENQNITSLNNKILRDKKEEVINNKTEIVDKKEEVINNKTETVDKKEEVINNEIETVDKKEEIINNKTETVDKKEEIINNNEITVEKVRKVLAEKSKNGKTEEVKGLLMKFGANKLSKVKKEDFREIILEAEKL